MTISRDGYHHGDLRNALVASAVRLIETRATSTFSLREAAREVGVSANAAYRHFDDKSALLAAVAGYGFGQLATQMSSAISAAGHEATGRAAVVRFKAVARAYVEFALAHPELFRVMFGECRLDAQSKALAPTEATPWTLLAQSLDGLVEEGAMPAARRPGAELKAWSVVHGFAALTLDGLASAHLEGDTAGGVLEALLDFAVAGLCGEMPVAA